MHVSLFETHGNWDESEKNEEGEVERPPSTFLLLVQISMQSKAKKKKKKTKPNGNACFADNAILWFYGTLSCQD